MTSGPSQILSTSDLVENSLRHWADQLLKYFWHLDIAPDWIIHFVLLVAMASKDCLS